ncbi:Uncharacterised protein [Mycolicibacterium vanbaalenii]|uniref:Uncharacterized protein n=1 Tax=Mycolicibacterium vanbaalenii TaxID=110539 RepID=A0A5S9R9A3_MYCVN|nr:Uncharacterised protein [Mycolicibacterium vanbaalenii]
MGRPGNRRREVQPASPADRSALDAAKRCADRTVPAPVAGRACAAQAGPYIRAGRRCSRPHYRRADSWVLGAERAELSTHRRAAAVPDTQPGAGAALCSGLVVGVRCCIRDQLSTAGCCPPAVRCTRPPGGGHRRILPSPGAALCSGLVVGVRCCIRDQLSTAGCCPPAARGTRPPGGHRRNHRRARPGPQRAVRALLRLEQLEGQSFPRPQAHRRRPQHRHRTAARSPGHPPRRRAYPSVADTG